MWKTIDDYRSDDVSNFNNDRMEIISLQSVELGATFTVMGGVKYYKPYIAKVGENLFTVDHQSSVIVDKIVDGDKSYLVCTSDGRIRKFPIDSYIAEYA